MTDKQIIIDGVDVSGCEFFESETLKDFRGNIYSHKYCNEITEVEDCSSVYECSDKERTDCYYKQLKRKEQECEELQSHFKQIDESNKILYQEKCELLQQLDELKKEYAIVEKLAQNSISETIVASYFCDYLEKILQEVKRKEDGN